MAVGGKCVEVKVINRITEWMGGQSRPEVGLEIWKHSVGASGELLPTRPVYRAVWVREDFKYGHCHTVYPGQGVLWHVHWIDIETGEVLCGDYEQWPAPGYEVWKEGKRGEFRGDGEPWLNKPVWWHGAGCVFNY